MIHYQEWILQRFSHTVCCLIVKAVKVVNAVALMHDELDMSTPAIHLLNFVAHAGKRCTVLQREL